VFSSFFRLVCCLSRRRSCCALIEKAKNKTLAKKKFSIFLEGEKRHEHMFQNIKKDEKLERPRGNGQTKI